METYSPTTTTTISSPLLLSYHGFFQQQKQNVTRAHKTLPNKPPCSCNLMDLHHPAGVTSTSPPLSMMKPLEDLTNFEIEDLLDFPTEEEGEDGDGDGEEEDGGEEAPPHSFVSELNSKSRNCAGIKSSKLQEEGLSIPVSIHLFSIYFFPPFSNSFIIVILPHILFIFLFFILFRSSFYQ